MDRKIKYYLGLYLFLKHENLLSMSLEMDFRVNLMNAFNLNGDEFDKLLAQVDDVINYDICDLYLQFDDE